jgi:phosphoenolpyruvate synthase/pyruvate phosphate dikinase
VGAQVPLVMTLDDPDVAPGTAGGKGAALGRLIRAGFRVPSGFCVTTDAYLDFVDRNGLREPLLAAMSAADVSVTAAGDLFAAHPVPAATATAIAAAYAALGDDVPVAVRSSATTEDRPGMSAAGQHDTYLNIRGQAAVLDAVKRCWASLWSARAIAYRARYGIGPGDVSMAVVVQRFVPAEAAGVMFTADPVSGARDRIVISANWGLGESVVAGEVTADIAVVDKVSGALVSYQTGSKQQMTVAVEDGTRMTGTSAELRAAAVLSPGQAGQLAQVGLAIEKLYDQPVDVEWTLAGGELSVVQARPVTTGLQPGEQWNDSLDGDYLWSNGNLGEALPDVMTPATWSFIQLLMTRMTFPPSLPGYRGYGRIGGRFYANVSMSIALEAVIGLPPRRFVALFSPVLGKLPPVQDIPRPRLPRWKVIRLTVPAAITLARRIRASQKRMPEFLADAPDRCDQLRAEIERGADAEVLARLWHEKVQPLVEAACETLAASTTHGTTLISSPGKLTRLVGEADSALLLSGQQAQGAPLASLGPVIGLARLARHEIDRDTFTRQYGHRGPHEMELSIPRPAEDPAWIDDQLTVFRHADTEAILAQRETARAATWEHLAQHDRKKAAAARKIVARWAPVARDREAARSECARSAWVARTWVRRAGELTGHGDDLFYLELDEVLALLRGDQAVADKVPARRVVYQTYRALPPYPALIRGHFDPVRWAADPDRRGDYYDEQARTAHVQADHVQADHVQADHVQADHVRVADTITGFPGAAGVVEGTARVLRTAEEAVQLGDGEILVTTVTNIGWTPVFPRAAAVVPDVGAPLSHAAIVARELGIPAVVGCGDATTRLHTGDRIRVDGGNGTVQVLRRA